MTLVLTDQEIDIVLYTLLKQVDELMVEQDKYWHTGNTLRAANILKTRRRLISAIAKIRQHSDRSVGTNYSFYV